MKRKFVILLCLCLLLAACGNEPVSTESSDIHSTVASTTEITTVPATTEATTEIATEPTAVLEESQSVRDVRESTTQLEAATYFDAADAFDEVAEGMAAMIPEENEEDVINTLYDCTLWLLEVQAGFTYAADDGSDRDLFREAAPTVFEFHVDPEYIEEFDYEAGYDVYRENDYIRIESEAFDAKTNEQLDFLRFEIATRENTEEIMLLFTRYDVNGYLSSSNRYLLYCDGETTQLVYSQTFGKTLEYSIDLNEWAKGTDYTWSEELLYPAK